MIYINDLILCHNNEALKIVDTDYGIHGILYLDSYTIRALDISGYFPSTGYLKDELAEALSDLSKPIPQAYRMLPKAFMLTVVNSNTHNTDTRLGPCIFDLPPIVFDDEEIIAVKFGLLSDKHLCHKPLSPMP